MAAVLPQLRAAHPPELMQLAVLLARGRQKREVAAVLGVPLSTIYRWLEARSRHPFFENTQAHGGGRDIAGLLAACEQRGVRVRDRARLLAMAGIQADFAVSEAGTSTRERRSAIVVEFAARDPGAFSEETRRRVQQVRERIDQEYFTHLSCADFSRIAAMSKYNLINRFRRLYGVSPYHYLLQVRIQHARKLLDTTPASLGAIASAVGFDSPSSLSKSFRNIAGVSLSEYCRGASARSAARDDSRGGAPLERQAG